VALIRTAARPQSCCVMRKTRRGVDKIHMPESRCWVTSVDRVIRERFEHILRCIAHIRCRRYLRRWAVEFVISPALPGPQCSADGRGVAAGLAGLSWASQACSTA